MPKAKQTPDGLWIKYCKECGNSFRGTAQALHRHFYTNPRTPDGLSYYCKNCNTARSKIHNKGLAVVGRRLSGL